MSLTYYYIVTSQIINKINSFKNYLWSFFPISWILKRKLRKFLHNTNKIELKNRLTRLLGNFENFHNHCFDKIAIENIVKWADETVAHQFNYLGSGLTEVNPIDWHKDFKSGYKWSRRKFYKKYVLVNLNNNADIKIVWELSRSHHLLWLGEAYLMTLEEKYAKEIVNQIENWIESNPLMFSINWTCTMDVAIRAVNWIYAINMIKSSYSVTDKFSKLFTQSIFEHGFFISNNLEKTFPYSGNHYASNIVGLLYISQFFYNTNKGREWWNFSLREYFIEIRQQILPSGVHFERSISYHRLVAELFTYPYLMLLNINEYIPIDIQYRIRSIFSFIANYIKPNGFSPIIGDNDDGRFLPFYKYDFRDHRYLLSVAAVAFRSNFYKKISGNYAIDNFFLLNNNGITSYDNIKGSEVTMKSKLYSDAGFCILREKDIYIFINNGDLSRYSDFNKRINGNHTHADLLSFELSIGNFDIIIDPGSYIYTASFKDRNSFRSTKKHNTLVIDDKDQYKYSTKSLFLVSESPKPSISEYCETNNFHHYVGSYYINYPNNSLLYHKRIINLHKDMKCCYVKDYIDYHGEHFLSMYFHFAPKLNVIKYKNTIEINVKNQVKVKLNFSCCQPLCLEVFEDTYSPSYGILNVSKTLKISSDFKSNFQIDTKIEWNEFK